MRVFDGTPTPLEESMYLDEPEGPGDEEEDDDEEEEEEEDDDPDMPPF
jgi:hypothetical protein